jgi:hypothetical protein
MVPRTGWTTARPCWQSTPVSACSISQISSVGSVALSTRPPFDLIITGHRENLHAVLNCIGAAGQGAPIPSTDNVPNAIYVSVDGNKFAD